MIITASAYYFFVFKSEPNTNSTIVTENGRQYRCNNINIIFKDSATQTEMNEVLTSVKATVVTPPIADFKLYNVLVPGDCSVAHTQTSIETIKMFKTVDTVEPNYINLYMPN